MPFHMTYVKTTETLKDYSFTIRDEQLFGKNEWRVRFVLAEASVPKDNVKGDRRFFFPIPSDIENDDKKHEYRIPFEYRPPIEQEILTYRKTDSGKFPDQDKILTEQLPRLLEAVNDKTLQAFLSKDQRTEKEIEDNKPELPLLLKRLRHYTRRNTSDYFIHKNLKGFLNEELDFYIKDQVLHIEDIDGDFPARRRMIKVLREIGRKVIDFLAQIEDAQKRLFEKKKFVLETSYLIPIQNIPKKFWPDIIANKSQIKQWQDWYAVKPKKDLLNEKGEINEAYLLENPTLVVDTRHFAPDWVRDLFETLPFDNLDDVTDGLIINSENYQALRILHLRFINQLACIYIDPPYNKVEGTFNYKNNYKHSSWICMMFIRLLSAREFLSKNGVIEVAIDDEETENLKNILNQIYDVGNHVSTIAMEINPAGQNLRPNTPALSHDYCHIYAKNIENMVLLERGLTPAEKTHYKEKDEKGYFLWDNLRRRGGNSRPEDRPNQYYPIYIDPASKKISIKKFKNSIEVWPVDPKGIKRIWRLHPTATQKEIEEGEISLLKKAGRIEIVKKSRIPSGKKPRTLWKDSRHSATTHGTKLLMDILGHNSFSYPKSVYLVNDCLKFWANDESSILDFFAGSGTTGHAVINLNREDGGQRKFILVEMGEYFDTVLLPRIAKVMYSPEWKNGKPKRPANKEEAQNTPRIVKVLRLEGYEDALHNVASPKIIEKSAGKEKATKELTGEDAYRLQYLVSIPLEASDSMLSLEKLEHPFNYAIEVLTD